MSAYPSISQNWPSRQVGAVPAQSATPDHTIRSARPVDVVDILALTSPHVAVGNLLPLDTNCVLKGLSQWVVVERPDSVLVGCGSLVLYNGALAELRSLVVAPAYHGQGIGRRSSGRCWTGRAPSA
ncbi:MAG: GNAT family N-acetyltransferase [Anaerolineae bacterium]|nr:GNAT family N-acetyltransferase [Anaerolineae bacterium]